MIMGVVFQLSIILCLIYIHGSNAASLGDGKSSHCCLFTNEYIYIYVFCLLNICPCCRWCSVGYYVGWLTCIISFAIPFICDGSFESLDVLSL